MVVALGIAFRDKPIEKITVDAVRAPATTALESALSRDARIQFRLLGMDECRKRLRTGKSDLYIIARHDASDAEPEYEYVYDPSRPGSLVARDAVNNLVQRSHGRTDPVATTDQESSEPGGRYIDFLVPGLIGMGLMGGGLWGVGFAIVDVRIRGLLKRMLATPMRRSHFLLGVMISRLVFMIPEIILLLIFARYAFGVQMHGNWLTIVVLVFLGAVEFSGIGLLVAARAKTLESVSGLMNLVMLPLWTLSGIFFSYERFPEQVQPIIQALPLTPLIDALRAVMLDGATLFSQWPRLLIITVWGLVTFIIALRIFRWHD